MTFAATLPVEGFRFLLSRAMTGEKTRNLQAELVMAFFDILRGYFHSPVRRKVATRMQGDPSCPSGIACSIAQCMEQRTQHNALIRTVNGRWREYIRRHEMYTRVPGVVCLRETGAPIKTGWAETGKGSGKPNVCARWVAKEYKTHTRPELYASTPPLEALKVLLSEIATGRRGGKVVALVDVRRAYFYAPARRRVFVEQPPEDYQAGGDRMCGLLQYSLYCTRDAAQNWKE